MERYEARLEAVRAAFARKVATLAPDRGFLVRFSGYGVGMTEPVERWIRRAGERCIALGLPDLGAALIAHARHEAGHDRMMVADLQILGGDPSLAAPPWPSGVAAYRRMHEAIIDGPAPWGQIAVEYEIEALSAAYGPRLLAQAPVPLSFVAEHVAIDEAHTEFNRKHLTALLKDHPGFLDSLADCGIRALETYGLFLDDCVGRASRHRVAGAAVTAG
jgi:hypothetical protein